MQRTPHPPVVSDPTPRIYSTARWQHTRALVLAEEPLCRMCFERDRVTPAVVVDHVVPLRDRPDLAFERANLQPLCKLHHDSHKQRLERYGYGDEVDARGYPIDARHPANRTRTHDGTGGGVASFFPSDGNRRGSFFAN